MCERRKRKKMRKEGEGRERRRRRRKGGRSREKIEDALLLAVKTEGPQAKECSLRS